MFSNVIQHLVSIGYAVYGLDLREHGRSSGQQGHINAWVEFREDSCAFLKLIEAQESDCPRFLLGHSLGSLIVLDYALRFPEAIAGVIAIAPPLGRIGVSPVKLTLGCILSRILPRFTLNLRFDHTAISRHPESLETLVQDSLLHSKSSARLATEFLATVSWIQSHHSDLRSPLLILHGGADQIALPEGSRDFFQQIVFPEKDYREYPKGHHALHNDLNYQEMLNDLEDWLAKHQTVRSIVQIQ
ncbi:MAG: lysophospholipase [Phormidium tanganyikae FI6-MK23]|jgi:alpha-beta hydrolase superfamily lysophospholipase|nr:lysophospholipase [Phormidium tanganyikae FI6-MK23]